MNDADVAEPVQKHRRTNPAEPVSSIPQFMHQVDDVILERINMEHMDDNGKVTRYDNDALAMKDIDAWCCEMKKLMQDFIDLREFIPGIVHTDCFHLSPSSVKWVLEKFNSEVDKIVEFQDELRDRVAGKEGDDLKSETECIRGQVTYLIAEATALITSQETKQNADGTYPERPRPVPENPEELADTIHLLHYIELVVLDRIHLDEEDLISSDDEGDDLSALAVDDIEAWCCEMKRRLQVFVDLRDYIPRIVHNELSHVSPGEVIGFLQEVNASIDSVIEFSKSLRGRVIGKQGNIKRETDRLRRQANYMVMDATRFIHRFYDSHSEGTKAHIDDDDEHIYGMLI